METIIECEPGLAKPNRLLQESSPQLANNFRTGPYVFQDASSNDRFGIR